MNRNSILLITLILLPFLAFTQQAEITVGRPYAVIDAAEKYYFHQENEILTVKIQGKRITLQKFGAESLSFALIKVYDDMPDGFSIENVAEYNNRFFVFYSLWDKRNELEQLYYREIDFSQGVFIGNGERIIKVKGKITGSPISKMSFWSIGVQDKFDFHYSYDESRLLIQYRLKPDIRNDDKSYDVIGMSVFDKNLDYLWNKEIKMPYTEKKMNNLDYSIDSEGNTYILSTVYNDNTTDLKKEKNGKANYHIELLRIKANSSDISITPIEVADKFINKIWLYESPGKHMVCAGFYNKGKDLDNADGVILFKVGKEGKAYDIANYEIPVQVLNQYTSQRTQKKNEKKDENDKAEFEELELRELKVGNDGSILLIGEQYFVKQHTYYSNGRTRTTYTYHYNDLLITKIDPTGKLAWMKKLPKRQMGRNGRGGMSYEYMNGKNSHNFMFLDNEKNMGIGLYEVPAQHSDGAGGFLTAYKIDDKTGEVTKTSVLNTRDVKGIAVHQFMTSRILPVSGSEFIFEAYKKKKEDVLIRVSLE